MVHHRCGYFSCWPIFFPFTTPYPPPHPLTALKTKISKKWRKKNTWTNHHFTQVCQNHEHMLYCSWDMVRDRCNCYFWFHAIFCPFYPHNSPKNENFKKMKKTRWKKKTPGEIIILHKCTKNHDHMLYCFWDMAHDRCNSYFSFCAIFCLFTP